MVRQVQIIWFDFATKCISISIYNFSVQILNIGEESKKMTLLIISFLVIAVLHWLFQCLQLLNIQVNKNINNITLFQNLIPFLQELKYLEWTLNTKGQLRKVTILTFKLWLYWIRPSPIVRRSTIMIIWLFLSVRTNKKSYILQTCKIKVTSIFYYK